MTIQGLQLLIYLGYLAIVIYVCTVIAISTGITERDSIGYKKNPKLHTVLATVGLIIFVLRPFKLEVESDNRREQVRHSFDTPVYSSDREVVEASNPSYELSDIREEKGKSRNEWNTIRKNEE